MGGNAVRDARIGRSWVRDPILLWGSMKRFSVRALGIMGLCLLALLVGCCAPSTLADPCTALHISALVADAGSAAVPTPPLDARPTTRPLDHRPDPEIRTMVSGVAKTGARLCSQSRIFT